MATTKQEKQQDLSLGTNQTYGIIGLPNVGKTKLFEILTNAENYPYCNIDPYESRVIIKDTTFEWLIHRYESLKEPVYLNIVDINGFVKGTSDGQGFCTDFLENFIHCDALIHLCNVSEDKENNPFYNLDILTSELRLTDYKYLNNKLYEFENLTTKPTKAKTLEYNLFIKVKEILKTKLIKQTKWNENEIKILNKHFFLTAKPIIYLVNLSENDYITKKNKWLPKIKDWIDSNDRGGVLIPFSTAFEVKLLNMKPSARASFFARNDVMSVLDKIIRNGHKFLMALPSEIKLKILKNCDYYRIMAIKQTNKFFCDFINKYKGSLLRLLINDMSFRNDNEHLKASGLRRINTEPKIYNRLKILTQKKILNVNRRIATFRVNSGLGANIEPFIVFKKKTRKLALELNPFPVGIWDYYSVKYWLEQIFLCEYKNIFFGDFYFNPEMIELLFDRKEIGELKFRCDTAYLCLVGKHFDIWNYTINLLAVNKWIKILCKAEFGKEEINALMHLLLNKGDKFPKVIIDKSYKSQYPLYNELINCLETSTNLTKVMNKIEFNCIEWPRSRLITGIVELNESTDKLKYYQIENVHNSKMKFKIALTLNTDDSNLIEKVLINLI